MLPDWLRYEIQERWERLALRKWINKNPMLIVSITIASVLVLLVVIGLSIPRKTPLNVVQEYQKGWFYDPNTGKLFVARINSVSSINAPSGTAPGDKLAPVRAYVFSYAYEPNEKNRFIGFLEISNPAEEKEISESVNAGASGAKRWGHGRLIRRVDDEQWVSADSNEGQAILNELFHPNKNGEVAHYCPPE
jgi:hypothetical protein